MITPNTLVGMIKLQLPQLTKQTEFARLLTGTVGCSIQRLAGIGFMFLANRKIALSVGPDQFGVYSVLLSVGLIIASLSQAGAPPAIVRWVALLKTARSRSSVQRITEWALLRTGLYTTPAGAIAAVAVVLCAANGYPGSAIGIAAAFLIAGGTAIEQQLAAVLQGQGRPVLGQIGSVLVRPTALAIGAYIVLAPTVSSRTGGFAAAAAIVLQFGSVCIALAATATILSRNLRPDPQSQHQSVLDRVALSRSSTVFLHTTFGVMLFSQADLILVYAFLGKTDAGYFAVACQIALLVGLGLQASGIALRPVVAKLNMTDNAAQIEQLSRRVSRVLTILAAPVAITIAVMSATVVTFVYDRSYAPAGVPLAILTIGQLANVAFGSVAVILNMSNHESVVRRATWHFLCIKCVLAMALIPTLGLLGGALASALGLVAWNLSLWRSTYRLLGIDPSCRPTRRKATRQDWS